MSDRDSRLLFPFPVLFFDGVCSLCDGSVRFLISLSSGKEIRFASLQSETGEEVLRQAREPGGNLRTVFYLRKGTLFRKSDAVLEVCRDLGGLWKFFLLGYLIPRFLRDGVYDWVARNRYRWFGKRETCRVPLPFEKDRFLD